MSPKPPRESTPRDIARVGDSGLKIVWADGAESVLPLREIRIACGCAVCRDELTNVPILDSATVSSEIRANRIVPVGNYALTFDWSDGHSTGIYPWEDLRALADRLSKTYISSC